MAGCRGQGCHSISDGAARASPWCHSSARLCGPEPVTLPQWASHCVLGRVTALTDVHVCARILLFLLKMKEGGCEPRNAAAGRKTDLGPTTTRTEFRQQLK